MKIKLTTLSQVLCASGESTANIDSDLKYDKYGFPYIQGRTFKGLLRESAMEVCEIKGKNYTNVQELFGTSGSDDSGILKFNDLRIYNYKTIEDEIIAEGNALRSSFVKEYYTATRQQTTIKKDGTAKDKSLRKYRLLKENIFFETEIGNVPDDNDTKTLLDDALTNLRYIGTRRNRGFGKVKIEVVVDNEKNVTNANKEISKIEYDKNSSSDINSLQFKIKTLDNIVVGKVIGEQNTVSTEKFIPAQNIRGLLAGLIIRNEGLKNEKAHLDDTFKEIILNGSVHFNNAFKDNTIPIPKCYGYDKTDNNIPAEIIFGADKPLKTMNGFAIINDTKIETYEVETEFSFHNSRFEDRRAGRSTKDDGAIFYYEAISKNQEFSTKILGEEKFLNYIKQLLEQNNGIHRVGKSKSAQYSRIKFSGFEIKSIQENKTIDNKETYILFTSPVITYNENGVAVPDTKILEEELKTYNSTIEIQEIASSHSYIENYMGVWKSKTPAEKAYSIGTTIKISFTGELDLKQLEINGLGERKAEGYGRIKVLNLKKEDLVRIKFEPEKINKTVQENIYTKGTKQYELLEEQLKEEKNQIIRKDAIQSAIKHKGKLPNSLISRLYDELSKANDFDSWCRFIKKIEGKKAAKTLEQARLLSNISILKVDDFDDFVKQKQYYLTYLKSLRKRNKSQKTTSNE